MAKILKAGNKVEWNTSQGRTSGTVKQKLTKPMDIKGHHVAASMPTTIKAAGLIS